MAKATITDEIHDGSAMLRRKLKMSSILPHSKIIKNSVIAYLCQPVSRCILMAHSNGAAEHATRVPE